MRALLRSHNVDEEPEDGDMEVYDRVVDEALHDNNVAGFNAGQKAIFNSIMDTIAQQVYYLVKPNRLRFAVTSASHISHFF